MELLVREGGLVWWVLVERERDDFALNKKGRECLGVYLCRMMVGRWW